MHNLPPRAPGYGITTDGVTVFLNASTCDASYVPRNLPHVFDVPIPEGCVKWNSTFPLFIERMYLLFYCERSDKNQYFCRITLTFPLCIECTYCFINTRHYKHILFSVYLLFIECTEWSNKNQYFRQINLTFPLFIECAYCFIASEA